MNLPIIDLRWCQNNKACSPGMEWFVSLEKSSYDIEELLNQTRGLREVWHVYWILCRLLKKEDRWKWAADSVRTVLFLCEKEFPENDLPRELLDYVDKGLKPLDIELLPKMEYESRGVFALQAAYMAYHSDECVIVCEQSMRLAFKAVEVRKRSEWLWKVCNYAIDFLR